MPYINPPKRIPLLMRFGIWISERITGEIMLPARLLAWYPKVAISSAILESLVAHHDGNLDRRILKLVRMQTSFNASCPFCIDMNSFKFDEFHITEEEIEALQGRCELADVTSFSQRERLAIAYARSATATPLTFSAELIRALKREFNEREMVILASTAAQVNYWARLIQSLGVPPTGFSSDCTVLRVEEYGTFVDSSKEAFSYEPQNPRR